jgi:hypothetical protein
LFVQKSTLKKLKHKFAEENLMRFKSVLWTALIVLAISFGVRAQDTGANITKQPGIGTTAVIQTGAGDTNTSTNTTTNATTITGGVGAPAILGGTGGAGGAGGAGGLGGASTANSKSVSEGGSATGGNAVSGANLDLSINSNYRQIRQAPTAIAPDAFPSAPCRVAGGIGVSSPFGGLSLGGSKLDKDCDARETARFFALINNRTAAAKILCNTKAAKKAKLSLEQCLGFDMAVAIAPPAQTLLAAPLSVNLPAPQVTILREQAASSCAQPIEKVVVKGKVKVRKAKKPYVCK